MFEDFTPEDRDLAERILDRAEQNGVTEPADQADLIRRIFGKTP